MTDVWSRRARRAWLATFAALNALAAWAGAVGLVTGGLDLGERTNRRLPFDSVVLAGLALAVIVAIPLTVLAWSAWTGAARTDAVALMVGLVLIGWIVLQVVVLRALSLLQPAYLGIGAAFVAASKRVRLGLTSRGLMLVAVGAIAVAAGIGLVPHPIKNGATITSAVAVLLLPIGIALVVVGVRSLMRARHRVGKIVVSAASVVGVALAVSIVAPAVAATCVPDTRVSSTPADVGLAFESITLTAADGVELAAWYVPGRNHAGLVVMHGAGSTRSAVLDQAAALVGSGYAVVLLDARGHGESRGVAMDFGWYGDLDVAAGTAYLASRVDIDPARIGVVGFSMGGEEAIGAAVADSRIRAVVAEGATGRTAADKAWLSDAYGWRGWLQEGLEHVQDGVTDLLTDASPPVSLRTAVMEAADTSFLLIAAGNVDDEVHAASYIESGAPERVTVWSVDEADHIEGYATQPALWLQHVIVFLDEHLAEP